ncbi:MAG: helix-turn-helix domain-containing protein [Bacteroidota bacterium]
MTSFSIFNWRKLIFKSELPANAKYIGSYLMTWMNENGDNCYPSVKRIAHETSLTEPTVCKYIQVLREEGWLETKKKGFDGKAWAHNQYYPNIPNKVLKEIKCELEGTKTDSVRHLNSHDKALKELNTITTDNSTVITKERDYPKELNLSAWNEYTEYRKESKIRKLTIKGEDKQIEKLIGFGDYSMQQQCVDETIANGWQGIFPPKNKQPNGYKSKATRFIDNLCDDTGYQ